MAQLYEGMFLLDNEVVREDWKKAKALAVDLLQKNGAEIQTARRWDERVLAYSVKRRQRGTYLLVHYTLEREGIHSLVRDLDLSEGVLRYMMVRTDALPEGELELHQAEDDGEFAVPAPPSDEVGRYAPVQVEGEEPPEGDSDDGDDRDRDRGHVPSVLDDDGPAPVKAKATASATEKED